MKEAILNKIGSNNFVMSIIGLGYVGLPLCKAFVDANVNVFGLDIDNFKINSLINNKTYIKHFTDETIKNMFNSGHFLVSEEFSMLSFSDAILITVPTPLDKMRQPDLSYVKNSCLTIGKHLKRGQLIILESTTYPGTTRDVVVPILEKESGLSAGLDFFVAYSPERENPGSNFKFKDIPKVVGGYTQDSLEIAVKLYSLAVKDVVPVSSCDIAEACKILENTYRAVNIAMVNELKMLFDHMNIDIWEVINAAKTKPFGFSPFYPGPGLGGHCIPIDPFYLSWKAKQYEQTTRFIELAGEINCNMPNWVVNKISESLNKKEKSIKGSSILIIGISYKPDIDDDRESPSYKIMDILENKGAFIDYYDPYVPVIQPTREYSRFSDKKSVILLPNTISYYDCVVILTNHSNIDYELISKYANTIVDTRNVSKLKDNINYIGA